MAASSEPAETERSDASERRRQRVSTLVFSLATIASRVAGMARQVGAALVFGATNAMTAFTVAFQIPNLVRSVVADAALSAAFVPVITELRERGDEDRAWRVTRTMCSLLLIVLVPLTVILMLLAPLLVRPFVDPSSFHGHDAAVAVDLTRILMPIVLLMAFNGIITGILNAYDHFASPALAPIAWNIIILGSLVLAAHSVAHDHRIYVYAIGTLVGTIVQVLIPVPWLRGGRLGLALRGGALRDPKIREILVLMLPVTISLGLINLQQLIDSGFATHVPHHFFNQGVDFGAGPAIIDNAFRVYMLPQGVFSVAISTVLFPVLARYAHRNDTRRFREAFAGGLRQIFATLVPCAVFMAMFATPIVRLLYQRGAFTPAQTPMVAAALTAFAVGLTFNGASLLVIRAFFSIKQTWLPTIVSVLTLLVNAGADLVFYRVWGVAGIAFATSIVNLVAFITLYALLRRQRGRLGATATIRSFVTAVVASVVASGVAYAVWYLLDAVIGHSHLWAQFVALVVALIVTAAVYLGLATKAGILDGSSVAKRLGLRRGGRSLR